MADDNGLFYPLTEHESFRMTLPFWKRPGHGICRRESFYNSSHLLSRQVLSYSICGNVDFNITQATFI